jgi:chromosome segregation ATPase
VVSFFKKYWRWIVSIVAGIISFILGRKSVSGDRPDFDGIGDHISDLKRELEQERDRIKQLVDTIGRYEAQIAELGRDGEYQLQLIDKQRKQIESITAERDDAERILNIAQRYHAETGKGLDGVDKLTGNLREIIERHRAELESIQVNYNDDGNDTD